MRTITAVWGRGLSAMMLHSQRKAMVALTVLLLVQSALWLLLPWLAGRFAGAVAAHRPVGPILAAMFATICVQAIVGYVASWRSQDLAARMIASLGSRLFDHLSMLPVDWHQRRSRGAILSLLTHDVERLGWYVVGTLLPLLPLLVTCAGAALMLLRIEPWIGLALVLLVVLAALVMRVASRKLRPLGARVVDAYAERSALAEQAISLLPVVKAYTAERTESLRYGDGSRNLAQALANQARIAERVAPLVRVAASACVLGLLWLGNARMGQGGLSGADLVTMLLYGLLLVQPVSQLAAAYGQTQVARGAARRVQEAFAQSPEPDDGTLEPTAVRGAIEWSDVHYTYPGRLGTPVLSGLDLRLAAGETAAIVGENGAGKSTLVRLLLRFCDPDAGSIRLDGHDLRTLRLEWLRGKIGLVSQQVQLFNASVRDNIAYGRRDATQAEIEAAARAARAQDFILSLPDGYDTRIGDDGIRLSGGQRQRIALARALLKDPPILILDEATAMFDPQGEAEFIAECHDVLRQRTVILITHRPASLALADRVFRMQHGRLELIEDRREHAPVAGRLGS